MKTLPKPATTVPAADQPDRLDAKFEVWKREIPNLDILTEGILQRIQRLARYFDKSMDETLGELGLDRHDFWLIGNLRYSGKPYRLTPGQLGEAMHLSSGAMTNRLDRAETTGLIRRLPDPTDRRGTLIEPTEAGHAAWDRSVGTQARREALITSALSDDERAQLYSLLRRLMHAFPPEYASMKKHRSEEDE
jgi:DNA-binding MarR family transcriptional regulator